MLVLTRRGLVGHVEKTHLFLFYFCQFKKMMIWNVLPVTHWAEGGSDLFLTATAAKPAREILVLRNVPVPRGVAFQRIDVPNVRRT